MTRLTGPTENEDLPFARGAFKLRSVRLMGPRTEMVGGGRPCPTGISRPEKQRMNRVQKKAWALLLAAAVPGFCTFSCSSTVARQFRDAALAGAVSFVEQGVFDALDTFWPVSATDGQ